MDVKTNTAADRLYCIVRDIYGIKDQPMLTVWATVLNLPTSNRLDVFRGILSVAELVNEVEGVVRRHGGHAVPLYIRALDQVRNILACGVDIHRSGLNGILRPEVVNDLEHCQAMYYKADCELAVPKEHIESIKNRVEELFQEIADAKFPDDLRNNLLDLLAVLRQQISEFQIRGTSALHECLRQSLSRLIEIYSVAQSRKDEPVFKKLFLIVSDINKLCELANKALPTWKMAKRLIPFILPDTAHTISESVDVELIPNEKG